MQHRPQCLLDFCFVENSGEKAEKQRFHNQISAAGATLLHFLELKNIRLAISVAEFYLSRATWDDQEKCS